MRDVFKFAVLFLFLLFPKVSFANDTCECPKLECNSECEAETNVTFYTEKCAAGARVKSCARPTCVALDNAPVNCGLAKAASPAPVQEVKSEEIVSRDIASVPAPVVAKILSVAGQVWIYSNKEKAAAKEGMELKQFDKIETTDNGKVEVQFLAKNGPSENMFHVTPNSEVTITESNLVTADPEKKRVVLDSIRGRIRNKVEKDKFKNDDQSHYRIKTPGAVAGVRGTDFVTSVEYDGDEVVSKVETLTGQVELGDSVLGQKVFVSKGEGASFVAPKDSVMSLADKNQMKARGYMTPVYKLNEQQISDLENATAFAKNESERKPAKQSEKNICSKPMGKFNQCSWTCENNPDGEKKCMVQKPGVQCVRKLCNANGQWSESMRLPAAEHSACDGMEVRVGPCDY